MQAKTIYRFEYSDGRGIFYRSPSDPKNLSEQLSTDDYRHPVPRRDSGLTDGLGRDWEWKLHKYHFGFGSLEQLRSWFYNDSMLSLLHERQVVIAEYLCYPEDIVVGNAQAIFKRDKSFGKTQYNIRDYFSL